MRPGGQPDNVDEALQIVHDTASTNFNLRRPAHYPDSQINALAQLVADLATRVQQLEQKPKRGRPPGSKNKDRIAESEIDRVRAELRAS